MPWMTPAEAAEYLRIKPRTLTRWRSQGIVCASQPTGTTVRYSCAELDKAMRRYQDFAFRRDTAKWCEPARPKASVLNPEFRG